MPLPKPVSPVWQPNYAPAGCRGYWLLGEGSGTSARDSAGSYHGTFVGSPTWQRGLYGPQLGGFTATNYLSVGNSALSIFAAGPPFWYAVMVAGLGSSTTLASAFSLFGTTSSQEIILYVNNASSGQVASFLRNNSGTNITLTANGTTLNDGKPHVIMHASPKASENLLYFDGKLVASNVTNVNGPFSLTSFTIGARNKGPIDIPFSNGSIVWTGAGKGAVPDPLALTNDLLSGLFTAARPRPSLALLAAATGGRGPAPAALMMTGL